MDCGQRTPAETIYVGSERLSTYTLFRRKPMSLLHSRTHTRHLDNGDAELRKELPAFINALTDGHASP
ncbi:hypothetical protein NDU88_003815 [Pleurodeles waltl]|uniref:Uncharacterized protein n=1 Tax=Pleurodeles waltl TaxID=8319 RepID=A0AAV7UEB8_PLEWA|nr:hypothetical protein NDU88_003815 [Pleurodeles waltl]